MSKKIDINACICEFVYYSFSCKECGHYTELDQFPDTDFDAEIICEECSAEFELTGEWTGVERDEDYNLSLREIYSGKGEK